MEFKSLKWTFFVALFLAIVLLIPYEWYWGNVEHWPKGHDTESLDIWADQRSEVSSLTDKDIVILGSSRAHFDINIQLWDSLEGRKPLQLAYPGSSPFVPMEDLIENTDFDGLLIVGVAPGLFFSTRDSWGAGRGKALVDRFEDRTYAQIFNQKIYYLIDPLFAFLQPETSLKSLLERHIFPNREGIEHPTIWPPMVNMAADRNIRMIPEMETDSVLQQMQKDIWFNPEPKNRFKDSIDVIMHHYASLSRKLQERGGKVVFVRAPIDGYYVETENELYPREEYWNRLLEESNSTGYHYADYPESRNMIPPEWSHLNRKDSDTFTKLLIELLHKDQLL